MHHFIKLSSIFVACMFVLQVSFSVSVAAQPVDPNQTDGSTTTATNPEEDGTTCAIEKIGWILCPVIEGAAKVGDASFSVLADYFLQVEPELVGNDVNGTRGAWEMARNIANVMFIIAFVIIIYSQITGAGLSNYGIKKMLPRLIIAAILVNISYYICQGLVDISNFLGYVIKDSLTNMAGQINDRAAMPPGGGVNLQEGGTLSTIAIAALASVAVIWYILPILGPMVALVVITALIIIVILLLRKAIIILLVVLSPIAFVAYLLPNTEKYYSKWLNMFWQLLMVFPIVALLFGSGQLASAVILAAGQNTPYKTDGEKCITLPAITSTAENAQVATGDCGSGSTTMTLGLVAAGISIAPLLAVWSVLQGALAAAGAIGGKLAGAIQNRGGSLNKSNRDKIAAVRERQQQERQARALNNPRSMANIFSAGGTRRNARRNSRSRAAKSGLEAAEAGFNLSDETAREYAQQSAINQAAVSAANIAQNSRLRDNIANPKDGMSVEGALGAASGEKDVKEAIAAQVAKATAEAIKDVELSATFAPGDVASIGTEFEKAVAKGDSVAARAFQNMLLKSGGPGLKEYRKSMTNLTSPGTLNSDGSSVFGSVMDDVRRNMIDNNSGVKGAAKDLMDQAVSGKSMTDVSSSASTWQMPDAELVAQKPDSLRIALGSPGAISRDQAKRIVDNKELSKHLSQDVRTALEQRAV